MGKILSFLLVVLALLLSAQPIDSQEFPFAGVDAYQGLLRAGYTTLERFAALLVPSKIPLLVDGGGDGGGGSGDGGGGSGDGGGTGTGGGTGDGGSGAGAAGGSGDGTGGAGTGGTGDGSGGNGDGTGDSSSAADAAAATSDAAASASTDAAATDAAATDAAAAAATDAAATDAAATNAAAVDNTAVDNTSVTDPTDPPAVTVNNAPTTPQTDQTTVTPELAAIMSIPTTDPRGGEDVAAPVNSGIPGGAAPALGGPGAAPVDVAINAVIVSAAQSPWDAIRRAPGVRNVIVTGGIIALGKTPIPGEIPGGGPQPAWLRLIPDLRLLNGSAIPPVVPNVIDIRIMNCPIAIDQINNPP